MAGDKKRFTEEQVREAIAHSDYTQHSIANYLARHFAEDHKCNDKTAARYILFEVCGYSSCSVYKSPA